MLHQVPMPSLFLSCFLVIQSMLCEISWFFYPWTALSDLETKRATDRFGLRELWCIFNRTYSTCLTSRYIVYSGGGQWLSDCWLLASATYQVLGSDCSTAKLRPLESTVMLTARWTLGSFSRRMRSYTPLPSVWPQTSTPPAGSERSRRQT